MEKELSAVEIFSHTSDFFFLSGKCHEVFFIYVRSKTSKFGACSMEVKVKGGLTYDANLIIGFFCSF